MKYNVSDYVGRRFGDLTVIQKDQSSKHANSNRWIVRCSCGKELSVLPSRIINGHTKSCGCKKGKSSLTHGCNGDEFYPTWWAMMRRCYNKNAHNYVRYGGRGIEVCKEWHDPAVFISWARSTIGHKTNGMTLDRIDNNQGYSPDNCRWASSVAQARNRRNNSLETINGETKTITEWCEQYGISSETVRSRQRKGMSLIEALTTPIQK